MTADEIRAVRKTLGLSVADMGRALRLKGANAGRSVRDWEAGRRQPSGPVSLLYEAFRDGRIRPESGCAKFVT